MDIKAGVCALLKPTTLLLPVPQKNPLHRFEKRKVSWHLVVSEGSMAWKMTNSGLVQVQSTVILTYMDHTLPQAELWMYVISGPKKNPWPLLSSLLMQGE